MRQTRSLDKIQSRKPWHYLMVMAFCFFVPALFAETNPETLIEYQWLETTPRCLQAEADRTLMQGFRQDWEYLQVCEDTKNLWWVLDVKPRKIPKIRTKRSAFIKENNGEVLFEFESDFVTRLKSLTTEKYTGPPKWMPPNLSYWDPAIGDWRYLKVDLNGNIEDARSSGELLLLWLKYEHIDDGLVVDASFDVNRVMEVFNIDIFRVKGWWSKVINFVLSKD
jgi:hypothetical protein